MSATSSNGRESEILIRELNHRVYNEFQSIANLLDKCARAPDADASLRIIRNLERRIFAFARLNRLLARPDRALSLSEYGRAVCDCLLRAYGREDLVLRLEADDLLLDDRELTYVSLALAELIVNALKYNFASDVTGVLSVWLRADFTGAALTVLSHGSSDPLYDPLVMPRTVHALASCVDGKVEVTSVDRGYSVRVRFPIRSAGYGRHDRPLHRIAQEAGGVPPTAAA